MWPKKNTAILIIHGIGEQDPFDTLDIFSRNFLQSLQHQNPTKKINLTHSLKQRKEWTDNCITFSQTGKNAKIDIYEYYWAHLTQRKISVKEIYQWLLQTSKEAVQFYSDNKEIAQQQAKITPKAFNKKGKFKKHYYLKKIKLVLRILTVLDLVKLARPAIKLWGVLTKWIPWEPIKNLFKKITIDYIGDIAIYTSINKRQKQFKTRQEIINNSLEQLKALLNDNQYQEIIIAGHSLGSVIAYDTLNKINNLALLEKPSTTQLKRIKGLISFGSPLDKIAFFFRNRTKKEAFIKRQIAANYHSFKNLHLNTQKKSPQINFPYKSQLDHVDWINFWHKKDPISGHLNFYDIPDKDNIELKQKEKLWFAHCTYWSNQEMYQTICDRFFS